MCKEKLGLDLHADVPLGRSMDLPTHPNADLISRLFAMMTARLEDAAQDAITGQAQRPSSDYVELVSTIQSALQECGTLADAVCQITDADCDNGSGHQ